MQTIKKLNPPFKGTHRLKFLSRGQARLASYVLQNSVQKSGTHQWDRQTDRKVQNIHSLLKTCVYKIPRVKVVAQQLNVYLLKALSHLPMQEPTHIRTIMSTHTRVFRKTCGKWRLSNFFFKQVFFVQEKYYARLGEPLIIADAVEKLHGFHHAVLNKTTKQCKT